MSAPFAALYWAVAVAYALLVAGQIGAAVFQKPRWAAACTWGVAGALAVHLALVAWRWIETGHVPVIGNFENALLGAWFIVAMTLWAAWRQRYPLLAAGSLPIALLLLGYGGASETAPSPFIASLQSFWLYIHILFAWFAHGAYAVSCGAGVVYLVKSRKGATDEALGKLDELMFRSTTFGFITDAVMLAAGAIWAKKLWGSYWSWDPVETWSLLSWLIYGVALHLRVTLGWKGRRLAWVLVFAIIGVLVSFWGVNLVMEGSAHVFNVD